MAISQADFYAFSQATGAPVPEDPEARARIAPQVMEWRRNQLKQPAQQEEGPNLVQTIGGLAAAAGVGTLAFLGGRRLAGAMAARRGVTPVNVQVQEDVVRRAAQPVPQLRGVTQRSGAQTARPPIPRPPTQPTPVVVRDITPPSAPPRGKTGPGIVDPWSGPAPTSYRGPLFQPNQETVSSLQDLRGFLGAKGRFPETPTEFQEYAAYGERLGRALPPAEEEFTAYRPDPKEVLSRQVADARRQAATEGLLQAAAARRGTYQPEIPGVKATLMELRAPAAVSAEEAGELVAQAESRPLSAAPAQQNLFKYVQQAAEPEGDAVDRLILEFEQLTERQARADQRAQASVRQYQMQLEGKALRVLDELKRESLVENQQAKQAFNVDQAINALESGEDQMTGRMRQQLQRNEGNDLGLIDQTEDLTGNIKVAASMTPDGTPFDQAEGIDLRTGERFPIKRLSREEYPKSTLGTTGLVPGQRIQMEEEPPSAAGSSAARFLEREREKIAQEMAGLEIAPMPADVEAELAKRLGAQAYTYGPKYTARRQALEIFAKTGDPKAAETIKRFGMAPVTFETFENMPAEKRRLFETRPPMSLEGYPSENLQAVVPTSGIEVNVPGAGRVDISSLRKPVVTEDTALAAEAYIQDRKEKAMSWLSGIKEELEPQLNEIFSERRAIIENQAAQIKPRLQQAIDSGNIEKVQELEAQLNALRYQFRNPQSHPHRRNESNILEARLGSAERKIKADMQTYERKYPTTLSDWSGESSRVFGEQDVLTGELIPETMELRQERRALDLPQKGGGGRNIAEFTAGQRLDEEVRAIQSGGRIRDYDPETGAVASRWAGDETQTGRAVDIYGVRLSGQRPSDPEVRPSVPQYTSQEIEEEALRMSQADPYGDVPMVPAYKDVVESLGAQPKTPESRRSLNAALELRRLQTSGRPGEAQAFLDKMMKQRGISGVSGTFSRIR